MAMQTCVTCKTVVMPQRKINWFLLLLLNVFYVPIYFLSKPRCPICRGVVFGAVTPSVASVSPAEQPTNYAKYPESVAQQMEDVIYDVRRSTVQAMESAYIIATSKTLDTVTSRYEFLKELFLGLATQAESPSYLMRVQQGIDDFKSVRYNAILESYQIDLVTSPDTFDLREFYAKALENVARRIIEGHLSNIRGLKREDAKQRRIEKMREDLQTCFDELTTNCRGSKSYFDVREKLLAALAAIQSGEMPQLQ